MRPINEVPGLEAMLASIGRRYPVDFFQRMANLPHAEAYVFGGAVRDLILGRVFKDVDVRVLMAGDWKARESVFERFLESEGAVQEKRQFTELGFTVYRFLPVGSASRVPLDVSLSNDLDIEILDFTVNSVFMNLATGALTDRYGGVEAIAKGVIQSLIDPRELLQSNYSIPFRAIKSACQFGFDIDPALFDAIRDNCHVSRIALEYIREHRTDLWAEVQLGNLFRGLDYAPERYIGLLTATNVMRELVGFLDGHVGSIAESNEINGLIEFCGDDPLCRRISLLLSTVARLHVGREPAEVFDRIRHVLALDEIKRHGELDVDISRIAYVEINR